MVCLCAGVSERKVRRAIDHGACTITEIGEACRAGVTCLGCHVTLETMIEETLVARPARFSMA